MSQRNNEHRWWACNLTDVSLPQLHFPQSLQHKQTKLTSMPYKKGKVLLLLLLLLLLIVVIVTVNDFVMKVFSNKLI
jgi:hypothetical protein